MRPRKKDEGGSESEFPPEDWFGEPDDFFYPVIHKDFSNCSLINVFYKF